LKKIGIIGGIGPESTVDYYKSIINKYRQETGDTNYPEIVIDSINMTRMLEYVANRDWVKLINQLLSSLNNLKQAEAEFAIIASNTPHIVFDQIKDQSPLPLLSIVEETCKYAKTLNLKKVLIIGTAFTMKSDFYIKGFKKYNIKAIIPNPMNQKIIQNIIFPDLEEGKINPEKKKQMIKICNEMISKNRVDGLVLGCTELPLMIKDDDFTIEVLNTTQIHVDSIISRIK